MKNSTRFLALALALGVYGGCDDGGSDDAADMMVGEIDGGGEGGAGGEGAMGGEGGAGGEAGMGGEGGAGGEAGMGGEGGAGGEAGMGGEGGAGGEGGMAEGPPEAFTTLCAACHGADGAGTAIGPEIRNPASWGYNDYVVRNGRGEIAAFAAPMSPYDEATIDQTELDAIWTWLGEAEKPADGQGLFQRFCVNCHDADGSGGRAGHGVIGEPAAQITNLVRGGHGGENYGAARQYMPAYDTDLITDAELALIIEYIGTL